MKITPSPKASHGSHRTGCIRGLSIEQISQVLGFKPNVVDDPDKVRYSWAGYTTLKTPVAIWDYKDSYRERRFSTYGEHAVLRELFGEHYTAEMYTE